MSEDGCYIVTLSSMEHAQCPVDPEFVRGEGRAHFRGGLYGEQPVESARFITCVSAKDIPAYRFLLQRWQVGWLLLVVPRSG